MLKTLESRECGRQRPSDIIRKETGRRSVALELSKYQDVEPVHTGGVNSLDIDLVEQQFLLSGASNGIIAIHDLHSVASEADAVQCTFPAVCHTNVNNSCRHNGSVETVQWYPVDTGMFISSSTDTYVKVWDTNILRTVGNFKFASHVYCHHLSPIATHHSLVAVAVSDSRVQLLDLKSGAKTHTLRGHRKASLVARWSPREEHVIATGGDDGQLLLWDVRSSRGWLKSFDQHNGDSTAEANSVNTAHSGRVLGLRFLPDGLRMLSVGTDRRVRLWDVDRCRNTMVNYGRIVLTGRTTIRLGMTPIDSGLEVAFVPSSSDVVAYGIEDGQRVDVLRGHYQRVNCAVYYPPTRSLFTGSNDRTVMAWTPRADEPVSEGLQRRKDADDGNASPQNERTGSGRAGLGSFARRVGGGTADTWSDED